MSTIAVIAHHRRDDARILASDVSAWLLARGHTVVTADQPDEAASQALSGGGWSPWVTAAQSADLALVLGGDGTMLHAVHALDGADVPLLGVNMGHLGYLTEIEPADVHDALERWEQGSVAGRWRLDPRMMLEVTASDAEGAEIGTWRALNEAVVDRQVSGTIHLQLHIDGAPFTTYFADGLIVATPTGSTAYSLSARGPIVSPKHRALLVTPVAPHMLFDRTLVLDPTEVVLIEVLGERPAVITIDGRTTCELTTGAVVRCAPATATASFVRFGDRSYHQVLKAKFGLLDR